MYAVIETGGKQYRVSPGQTVEVELLPAEPGASVTLDRVLLVSNDGETQVGAPVVAGAAVVATVIGEGRGKKIIVFRYKSKKRYRRTTGHRQDYTYLTVTDIQANGESLVADDERRRFERLATRAANRYEARLLAAFASPVATPDLDDEEDVIDVPDDEAPAEAEDIVDDEATDRADEADEAEADEAEADEADEAADEDSDDEDGETVEDAEPEPPTPPQRPSRRGRK